MQHQKHQECETICYLLYEHEVFSLCDFRDTYMFCYILMESLSLLLHLKLLEQREFFTLMIYSTQRTIYIVCDTQKSRLP